MRFMIAFMLTMLLGAPASAEQRKGHEWSDLQGAVQLAAARPALTGDLAKDLKSNFSAATGVAATGDLPFDLLKALDAKLLPDLQYALKLAQANNSTVTAPCYQAWIDIINRQIAAVQIPSTDDPNNTTMTDMPTPEPHLITDFERIVSLRNALQPDSKFMTACSPVANLIRTDVISFLGRVVSGGAGLAALVPGL